MRRRFAGFTLFPLFGVMAPLLVLPVAARAGGPEGWQSLGVGQSVGAITSVIVLWGWWATGPALLAETGHEDHPSLYVRSLEERVLVLLFAGLPLLALACVLSAPDYRGTAALMWLGAATVGLSPSWFAVGVGKPGLLAAYSALPNAIAVVASTGIILASGPIWWFPALLVLANVLPPLALAFHLDRNALQHRRGLRRSISGIRAQTEVASSNLVGTIYAGSPTPVASAVAPIDQAGQFVSADRIYRIGSFATASLGNALQSWVLERGPAQRSRQRRAITAHLVLGVAGGSLIAAFGHLASRFLFGQDVQAPVGACIGYGMAFLFASISSPLGRNLLIPYGKARVALSASVLAAGTALPAMFILYGLFGVTGIAGGMALGEFIVLVIRLRPALQILRSLGGNGPEWKETD